MSKLTLDHNHWKRSRHRELDEYRTFSLGFNRSWVLFFRTMPPGLNINTLTKHGKWYAEAVFATEVREPSQSAREAQGVGGMYGSRI